MAKNSSYIRDFAVKGVVATGLGIFANALVEVLRAPFLNDSGAFGNKITNYELIAYTISGSITVLSTLDILLRSKPFNISRDALPYSVFFILGTSLWDSTLSGLLGLRNFNIYQYAENAIPNISSYV